MIVVQGSNSAPYLKWQGAPNGAWSEWVYLGGVRSSSAASGKSVGGLDAPAAEAPATADEPAMPEAPADAGGLPDVAE